MIFVATLSNPEKIYFGLPVAGERNMFKGKEGFWVVYDHGEVNHARLIEDDSGKPKGYYPVFHHDGEIFGYAESK